MKCAAKSVHEALSRVRLAGLSGNMTADCKGPFSCCTIECDWYDMQGIGRMMVNFQGMPLITYALNDYCLKRTSTLICKLRGAP